MAAQAIFHLISRGWCAIIIYAFLWKLSYPGVAQIGSALEWGSRGRRFDSCHSDHVAASFISLAATFLQKSPARSFRCVAFSAKSHAGSSYALVNAGITPPLRYQLFAGASAVHGRFLESYNSTQVFYLAKCRYEHPYQTCGRQFVMNCRPLFTMWFDLKRNFLNHLNIVIADFVLSSMAFFICHR